MPTNEKQTLKSIGIVIAIILIVFLPILFIFGGCDPNYQTTPIHQPVITIQQPIQPTPTPTLSPPDSQASTPIQVKLVDAPSVPPVVDLLPPSPTPPVTINVSVSPPPIVTHIQLSCPFGTIYVPENYVYSLLGGYRLVPAFCDAGHVGMIFHGGYWASGLWHGSSWDRPVNRTIIINRTTPAPQRLTMIKTVVVQPRPTPVPAFKTTTTVTTRTVKTGRR